MAKAERETSESRLADSADSPWWLRRRGDLLKIGDRHLNAYVYDGDSVRRAARRLLDLEAIDRVLFAMKSNFNPDILRLLAAEGADFECVSPQEIEHLRRTLPDLDPGRILFTPNFAPREDYAWARENGVCMTLDNLYPLRAWPETFRGARVFVRIDPGVGRGHHEHVITSGEQSKFGIPRFEIDELESLAGAAGATVIGIHAHSGSGIPEADTWGLVATALAEVADRFPEATVLDLGGGLGVPSRAGDPEFDLEGMNRALMEVRERYPDYSIWLEPGRYLVAEDGVLLDHVTQLKGKGEKRYVGVSTGMNALIRPSLYGAYHEIVNLTRYGEPTAGAVTVVGPICETGDTLGHARDLPDCQEHDVMLLLNAGAYGRVMASEYNLRPVPPEIVLDA